MGEGDDDRPEAAQDRAAPEPQSAANHGHQDDPVSTAMALPDVVGYEQAFDLGEALDLDALPRGTAIANYVLLGRFGDSPLGPVYAAFDTQNDKKVAVRLVPMDPAPATDEQVDPRRELATALGPVTRLNHPCIVAVYHVAVWSFGVLIASEFFDGIELESWMAARDQPFPWREVLRKFREAGRGLSAAHRSGVLHGDFKPNNVMMGSDGQIRVVDFGLPAHTEYDPSEGAHFAALRQALGLSTQDDTLRLPSIVGAAEYAAPEVLVGEAPDPRSDQYSFCTALYEALYGERPFAGNSAGAIAGEIAEQRLRPAPPNSSVPRWLRAAVLRGLALQRTDRWPSMDVLLRELDRDPASSRRRWLRGSAVLGAALVGMFGIAWQVERAKTNCEIGQDQLNGVWDPSRRETLYAELSKVDPQWGPDQSRRVSDELDRWISNWLKLRSEACVATRIRGDASDQLYQQRLACLDARLDEFQATVATLENLSAPETRLAHRLPEALTTSQVCTKPAALRETNVTGELSPERARELGSKVDQARTLLEVDRVAPAQQLVAPLLDGLDELHHPGLQADILRLHADIERRMGQRGPAEVNLHAAARRANRGELDYRLAAAWTDLAALLAQDPNRGSEARQWLDYAENVLDRIRDEQPRWRYAMLRGDIDARSGHATEALGRYHEALAELDAPGSPDWPRIPVLQRLGDLVFARADYVAAERYQQQRLAVAREVLGPQHPDLAPALLDLADAEAMQGRSTDARGTRENALALLGRNASGPDEVIAALLRIAAHARAQSDFEPAIEYARRATELAEQGAPTTESLWAAALLDQARSLLAQNRSEAARDLLTRANEHWTAALSQPVPANVDVATREHEIAVTRAMLAHILAGDRNSRGRAQELARQARASVGPNAPDVERWLVGIADGSVRPRQ